MNLVVNAPGARMTDFAKVAALFAALVVGGVAVAAEEGSQILVPGGAAAVGRVLGPIDPDPARFAADLNRALLQSVRDDHDARAVRERSEFLALFTTAREIQRKFGGKFEFPEDPVSARGLFMTLAETTGYAASGDSPPFDLEPLPGPAEAARRRAAIALGCDLHLISQQLEDKSPVRLIVPTDAVRPPVSWETLEALADAEINPHNALEVIATDQRLSLVLEGLRRLTRETAAALTLDDLLWIKKNAPVPFLRHGWAFEIRAGRVVLPGGPEYAPRWAELAGASPDDPAAFLRALLQRKDGRVALFFQGLAAAPPVNAQLLLRPAVSEFVLQELDDDPRGFAAFVRSAPTSDILLFADSVADDSPGDGPAPNWPRPSSPAETALASFAPVDEATRHAYSHAVRRLRGIAESTAGANLIASFQGGIELLSRLRESGVIGRDACAALFSRWSDIHASLSPRAVIGAELDWLSDLLAALPDAPARAPGRGPLERKLLAALSDAADPQEFTWDDLPRTGTRGKDRAAAMLHRLEAQAIASADQLVGLHRALLEISAAGASGDRARAQRSAREAQELLASLPPVDFDPPLNDPRLVALYAPEGRAALNRLLAAAAGASRRRLASLGRRTSRASVLLGADLRVLLVAPKYLLAIGDKNNILFDESNLVRRHSPFRFFEPRIRMELPEDDGWSDTRLVAASASSFGARIAGHVSGVPAVLGEFALTCDDPSRENGLRDRDRLNFWWGGLATESWRTLSPPVTRVAAAALAAGGEIASAAAAGDEKAREFVAARVPLARVERGAVLVSPSERVLLALAAAQGDAFGHSQPELLTADSARELGRALAGLGDDWREKIKVLGAPTPAIDGRATAWFGAWPPYEAVEGPRALRAVCERQWVDVRIAVAGHLGRRGMPGAVGRDLAESLLRRFACGLPQETPADWEGFIASLGGLDDRVFDKDIETCLSDGLYRARRR